VFLDYIVVEEFLFKNTGLGYALLTICRGIFTITVKITFQGARIMKKIFGIIALAVLTVIVASTGCKKEGAQKEETSTARYQIAVIPKGTTHVFWKSIHAGAVKAEQATGNRKSGWWRIS